MTDDELYFKITELEERLSEIDGQITHIWEQSGRSYENGDVILIPYQNNDIIDELYAEREEVLSELDKLDKMEATD